MPESCSKSQMADELKRFVRRAEKLELSSFWAWLKRKRGAADMGRIIAGDWLAHDGLNQEAFEAFCLNLRLLVQDTDGFSIRKVAGIAETWPDSHKDLRDEIHMARSILKQKLDESCLVQILEGKRTTNWDLFDIVFYGGMVHENHEKREKFDEITSAGLFSYFMFQAFIGVLFHYRNCILRVGVHAERYLIREGFITDSE